MLRHVAAGYSSHLQRLLGLSWFFLGDIVPRYTELSEAGDYVRGVVFMTCEWPRASDSIHFQLAFSRSPFVLVFEKLGGRGKSHGRE